MKNKIIFNLNCFRNTSIWVSTLTCLLSSIACVDSSALKRKSNSNLGGESGPAAAAGGGSGAKYNPLKASASASMGEREFAGIAKGAVPTLTLSLSGADYAEIWRCNANYKLVYGNGQTELASLSKSDPDYQSTAKEAFERMRTEGSYCTSIAPESRLAQVNDYGARSGQFYYIINPCVSKESSSTGRAGCSYALQVTEVMEYANTRTREEIKILNDMYIAEGEIYSLFHEMKQTIESANAISTTCVLDEAERLAAEQHRMGFMKIFSSVGSVLLNALVPGVGAVLSTGLNTLMSLKQQQSMVFNSDCPAAAAKIAYYQELSGKVQDAAAGVLEKRQKLHQLDQQYASVEKELSALKSSMNK